MISASPRHAVESDRVTSTVERRCSATKVQQCSKSEWHAAYVSKGMERVEGERGLREGDTGRREGGGGRNR